MQRAGKILFVATVARHLLAFHQPYIRLLQDWGWEVEAACNPAGEADAFAGLGVRLNSLPFSRRPLSFGNLKALFCLIHLFKSRSYALVHVHTPVAAFLTRLAARLCGFTPVIYTAHGFHFYRGAPVCNWLLYYVMEWLAARWTDALIVLNSEDFHRAQKLPVRGKVYLLPGIGVDLDDFRLTGIEEAEIKKELHLKPDVPLAVIVAELSGVKNHEQAFRAWQKVVREFPEAVLMVVGEGERRRALEELVRRLGLERSVKFLGFRTDVPRVVASADLAVLTSKREGLPRVVLEAMAAGKPVVATDVRGSRDLVKDGETGFLVKVGDVAGTARALTRLLRSRELRSRMGEEGKRRVKPYALTQVREMMAGIYRFYLESEVRRKNNRR